MEAAAIINRGRGPEIAGTRITVYTIIDYLNMGWHHTLIAATLRISSAQVQAAQQYIEDHKEDLRDRVVITLPPGKNVPV